MTDTLAPILLAATRKEMRGLQGVGKSSTLLAILTAKIILQNKSRLKLQQKEAGEATNHDPSIILFKWPKQTELFLNLLDGTHEASTSFCREYGKRLPAQFEFSFPLMDSRETRSNPERLNF
jgi:hypothetical protein